MHKSSQARRLNVCLLSSHPLVLKEFQSILSRAAFRLFPQHLESTRLPDPGGLDLPSNVQVYVVDVYGPRGASEAHVAGIFNRFPSAHVLVIGEKFSEASAFPFLRLGTKGLLNYAQAPKQLAKALRAVSAGGFWVPRSLLSRFVDSILSANRDRSFVSGAAGLTPREREVLDVLLENLTNKEIANKLNISERTVKFHVSNLLSRFEVQRRQDLIMTCLHPRISAS